MCCTYFFLEMRKQWSWPHGQVPGNPGEAEESGFRSVGTIPELGSRRLEWESCADAKTTVGPQVLEFLGLLGGPPPLTWLVHSLQVCFSELLWFSWTFSWFPHFCSPPFLTVSEFPLILLPLNFNLPTAPHSPLSTQAFFPLHILYKLSLQTAPLPPRFCILTPES